MTSPAVSVIMPTHNRATSLARVLDALGEQTYPMDRLEVIVVADGCSDRTIDMLDARTDPFELKVVAQRGAGPAVARNKALELATGELIVFLDDDVLPSPALIEEHVGRHQGARNLVVIGPLLPPKAGTSPWVRWEGRTLRRQYQAMTSGAWKPSPRQFYTGNASVLAEHVRRAGGFDTSYRRAEDVELAFRLEKAGLNFVFHEPASGLHQAERTFGAWLAAAYEYGRADVAMGPVLGSKTMADQKAEEVSERNPVLWFVIGAALA